MIGWWQALPVSVAVVALHAAPVAAAAEKTTVVPAAVGALLDAKATDGGPLVGPEARAYFDGLPDHAKELTAAAVAGSLITAPVQLAELLGLGLSTDRLEFALRDNCLLCHTNPDLHGGPTLLSRDPSAAGSPAHMDLAAAAGDVHFRRGISCAGCHGGDPSGFMAHDFPDTWPKDASRRRADRSWIPAFCSRCHGDAAFMRGFNPGLPTDQLAKYASSRHGMLLLGEHDSRAAQCVSCHGAHGILSGKSPRSTVHPKRIPDTCGACHANSDVMKGFTLANGTPMPTDQVEQYRASVHGRALFERNDIGVAVCNDCHGNHAAMPPGVASVAQICRACHAGNGALFDGSKHKQAFERHGWPECATCHGKHAIAKTSDEMLAASEPRSMCADCHARHAAQNPECNRTAAYFYETITGLREATADFRERAAHLAERGLDVDRLVELLGQTDDAVRVARSYIHTFDRSDFRQVVEPAQATLAEMSAVVDRAKSTYSGRRLGLIVSAVLIAAFALLVYLKLRRFERAR